MSTANSKKHIKALQQGCKEQSPMEETKPVEIQSDAKVSCSKKRKARDGDIEVIQAKRLYKRMLAARNRAKTKNLISTLSAQVKDDHKRIGSLEHENRLHRIQIEAIKGCNTALVRQALGKLDQVAPSIAPIKPTERTPAQLQLPQGLGPLLPPKALASLEALLALQSIKRNHAQRDGEQGSW